MIGKLSPASAPASAARSRFGRIAYWMDSCFRVPGTGWRFGWEAILGLVLPGLGDAAGLALGVPVVVEAFRRRHPWPVRWVMLANLALDAAFGMVPLVGDAFDFLWKAQSKNLMLLEDPEAWRRVVGEARGHLILLAAVAIAFLAVAVAGVGFLAWWLQAWLRAAGF